MTSDSTDMKTINIIGSGIAGSALARCLQQRGIPTTLFSRAITPPANSYGITFHRSSYRKFLEDVNINTGSFERVIFLGSPPTAECSSIFAHRGKLEAFLHQGLDIRYGWGVQTVTANEVDRTITLEFNNDRRLQTRFLVAADGEHSDLRKQLTRNSELIIHPIVAYHGSRVLKKEDFDERYAHFFSKTTKLETLLSGNIRLSVEAVPDERRPTLLMRYTYSRPARGDASSDPLFRPTRDQKGAIDIPPQLFDEFAALPELPQPFKDAFEPTVAKGDRVLHWLQRTCTLSDADVDRLCDCNVAMIGQAAHVDPILGGEGAKHALEDAVELARWIEKHGTDDLKGFYEGQRERWIRASTVGEERLTALHEQAEAGSRL